MRDIKTGLLKKTDGVWGVSGKYLNNEFIPLSPKSKTLQCVKNDQVEHTDLVVGAEVNFVVYDDWWDNKNDLLIYTELAELKFSDVDALTRKTFIDNYIKNGGEASSLEKLIELQDRFDSNHDQFGKNRQYNSDYGSSDSDRDVYDDLNERRLKLKHKNKIKHISELEKILLRFKGNIISEHNNILFINFSGHLFYYSPVTRKLRIKGSDVWRTDVIQCLDEVINNKPPKKKPEPKMKFGKYKGETVASIKQKDPNYIAWCIREKILV